MTDQPSKNSSAWRRALASASKFILFLIIWAVAVSIPLALWERPAFLAGNPAWLRLYWEVAPLLMTIAVTVLFVALIDKWRLKITLSNFWLRDSLIGVSIGAVWVGGALLILRLLGVLTVVGKMSIPLFAVYIAALFFNTTMQELLVRGYLYSFLKAKHGIIVAVTATTLLFTALHAAAFEAGIVAVLNVITASILLSLLLIYTNGLWAPILAHFVWNFVGGLILNAVVLGDDISLFRVSLKGCALLTAGAAKIEGSIVVLILNLVICAALFWLINTRSQRPKLAYANNAPGSLSAAARWARRFRRHL